MQGPEAAEVHGQSTVEGDTYAAAIVENDRQWAEDFGVEYPLTEDTASETWSIEYSSIATAPCLKAVVTVERRAIVADAMPAAQPGKVKISWFVVLDGGERMRRQDSMRGTWAWDATCSCGWDSRTGGAVFTAVRRAVNDHKRNEHGLEAAL